MLLFSKSNKTVFVYFDPDFFFEIMKITNFRGDLDGMWVKKEPLSVTHLDEVKLPSCQLSWELWKRGAAFLDGTKRV